MNWYCWRHHTWNTGKCDRTECKRAQIEFGRIDRIRYHDFLCGCGSGWVVSEGYEVCRRTRSGNVHRRSRARWPRDVIRIYRSDRHNGWRCPCESIVATGPNESPSLCIWIPLPAWLEHRADDSLAYPERPRRQRGGIWLWWTAGFRFPNPAISIPSPTFCGVSTLRTLGPAVRWRRHIYGDVNEVKKRSLGDHENCRTGRCSAA